VKVRLVTVSRATEQEWLRLRSQATAVRRRSARRAARAHGASRRDGLLGIAATARRGNEVSVQIYREDR
jgi:hypothetical protein